MAKILIADDSIIMRRNLRTILSEAGHTVIAEVGNGFQACLEYEKYRPELVAMDIDMPFVSGLEALKIIISKHPNANIIILSNKNSSRIICEAMNIGAKAVIIKPFRIQELIDTVDNVLNFKSTLNLDSLEKIYNAIEKN